MICYYYYFYFRERERECVCVCVCGWLEVDKEEDWFLWSKIGLVFRDCSDGDDDNDNDNDNDEYLCYDTFSQARVDSLSQK